MSPSAACPCPESSTRRRYRRARGSYAVVDTALSAASKLVSGFGRCTIQLLGANPIVAAATTVAVARGAQGPATACVGRRCPANNSPRIAGMKSALRTNRSLPFPWMFSWLRALSPFRSRRGLPDDSSDVHRTERRKSPPRLRRSRRTEVDPGWTREGLLSIQPVN